jgi:hypothetical protein
VRRPQWPRQSARRAQGSGPGSSSDPGALASACDPIPSRQSAQSRWPCGVSPPGNACHRLQPTAAWSLTLPRSHCNPVRLRSTSVWDLPTRSRYRGAKTFARCARASRGRRTSYVDSRRPHIALSPGRKDRNGSAPASPLQSAVDDVVLHLNRWRGVRRSVRTRTWEYVFKLAPERSGH